MVFLSPDFAKLRFRKTLHEKEGSFALNGPLYELFFAVEENRSVAQIAAELGIPLADARQTPDDPGVLRQVEEIAMRLGLAP